MRTLQKVISSLLSESLRLWDSGSINQNLLSGSKKENHCLITAISPSSSNLLTFIKLKPKSFLFWSISLESMRTDLEFSTLQWKKRLQTQSQKLLAHWQLFTESGGINKDICQQFPKLSLPDMEFRSYHTQNLNFKKALSYHTSILFHHKSARFLF